MSFCEACFEKLQEIDSLKAEIENLKARLQSQIRNAKEKPFGSSTSSSKTNLKSKSSPENQKLQGGAKNGHDGHGRTCCTGTPDKIIEVPSPGKCPDCGCNLHAHDEIERTVKDMPALKVEIVLYQIKRGFCPQCQKKIASKAMPVLSRSLLGNELLTHIADQHYLQDTPLGRLENQLGIKHGTLIGSLHR